MLYNTFLENMSLKHYILLEKIICLLLLAIFLKIYIPAVFSVNFPQFAIKLNTIWFLLSTSQRNEMKIDKVTCTVTPNTYINETICIFKYIDRYHIKMNFSAYVRKPIYAWINTKIYYKYNGLIYHRFGPELWKNTCDWLSNKTKSDLLEWTYRNIQKYSNANHPCPYEGIFYIKVDNISIRQIDVLPLSPAGKSASILI